ncbi:MAG: YchF family ATPase [Syntrophobacterales bacterium]|jgi:GTP-binding protein YchF|nr:YchF family ATPase [Syntrophobacterales bacterium]
MHISIIGTAGSGKSTLFLALSGISDDNQVHTPTLATIDVPDERLDNLTQIFKPKKTVYARIELSDTLPIGKNDLRNETIQLKALQQMRLSDAFLLVLPAYRPEIDTDPYSHFALIYSEFILSDMSQIETRLERISKQMGKKDNALLHQEKEMLERCLEHLNKEQPLSTLDLLDKEGKTFRGFQFLSQKPMLAVMNCAEEMLGEADKAEEELNQRFPGHLPLVTACAKLESELALMSSTERDEYMQAYDIKEALRPKIIRLAYDTLGLLTFFTVGEDECRSWPIKRGMTAQEAAGTIHTDFYNKFIRAETVAYDDFLQHGGFAGCKKAGLWRLEGKTYVVQDGDILTIRAGN